MQAPRNDYTVREGSMEEKEEENLAAPERAVLPPTPRGTTVEATKAALPPDIGPSSAEPDKLL